MGVQLIEFIDGQTGRVVAVEDAANVPDTVRYADTPSGRVSVVRVVAYTAGNRREIREYAEGGQLVRSTVQLR